MSRPRWNHTPRKLERHLHRTSAAIGPVEHRRVRYTEGARSPRQTPQGIEILLPQSLSFTSYRLGLATATFVVGLISTRYAWYTTLPRFSIECSGWLLGSNVTCISFSSARGVLVPSAKRRWEGGSRK